MLGTVNRDDITRIGRTTSKDYQKDLMISAGLDVCNAQHKGLADLNVKINQYQNNLICLKEKKSVDRKRADFNSRVDPCIRTCVARRRIEIFTCCWVVRPVVVRIRRRQRFAAGRRPFRCRCRALAGTGFQSAETHNVRKHLHPDLSAQSAQMLNRLRAPVRCPSC